MRFFLIAHGLVNKSGHHYMEARAFKEESVRHQIECHILAHRGVDSDIQNELQAIPVFRHTPYDKLGSSGPLNGYVWYEIFARKMKGDFIHLAQYSFNQDDVVVSPLTRARDIYGMALWLRSIPAKNRPRIAINFMIDDITQRVSNKKKKLFGIGAKWLYRHAFTRLCREVPKNRIVLSAGGRKFAETMSEIVEHKVQVFPLPVQHNFTFKESGNTRETKSPLVVYLGHTHIRKGADLVGSVVKNVLSQNPNVQFFLQANSEEWAKKWKREIGEIESNQLCIHEGELAQNAYQKIMSDADVVLMPYHPDCYGMQTSGIFSETMAMGKTTIIPENTWMAEVAVKYNCGCVVYKQHDVEHISEAILKALSELTLLKSKMEGVSKEWKNNMGMKGYVQRIIDGTRI